MSFILNDRNVMTKNKFALCYFTMLYENYIFPDNKVHVAHKGPTWVLSAPGGTHVGPMNLVIRVIIRTLSLTSDNTLIVYSANSWELTKFTLNFPNSIVPLLGQYCWHLTCKDSYCMPCCQDHENQVILNVFWVNIFRRNLSRVLFTYATMCLGK